MESDYKIRYAIVARNNQSKGRFKPLFKNDRTYSSLRYAKNKLSFLKEYFLGLDMKVVEVKIKICKHCGK